MPNRTASYPDDFSVSAYDRAQGFDYAPNDVGEIQWIKGALELLNEAADKLSIPMRC
jgi:hypothetical protein